MSPRHLATEGRAAGGEARCVLELVGVARSSLTDLPVRLCGGAVFSLGCVMGGFFPGVLRYVLLLNALKLPARARPPAPVAAESLAG